MTSDSFGGASRSSSTTEMGRVPAFRNVGLGACVLGVVVGIAMIAVRREVECPDGTFFPEGTTDFRCFEHPQALGGSAVVLICLALAAVIALCAMAAADVVSRRSGAMLLEVHGTDPAPDSGSAADPD